MSRLLLSLRLVMLIVVVSLLGLTGFNAVKPCFGQMRYVQTGGLDMAQDGYMQVFHGGSSFDDQLPWGQRFSYSKSNIEWPQDHSYYVTVIYSTRGITTHKDRYLRAWFEKHPALVSLKRQTNFYSTHAQDPAYESYLKNSLPITPAVLITKPPVPGRGYFGEVVYCAYGQYLSTNPDTIAREIQTALSVTADRDRYAAAAAPIWRPRQPPVQPIAYPPQQYPRIDPRYPDYPPQYPQTRYPQQYPPQQPNQQYPQMLPPVIPNMEQQRRVNGEFLDIDLTTIALLIAGVVILYLVLNKRNGRRSRR